MNMLGTTATCPARSLEVRVASRVEGSHQREVRVVTLMLGHSGELGCNFFSQGTKVVLMDTGGADPVTGHRWC